jgi:diacylglycerol kinase family enzyme
VASGKFEIPNLKSQISKRYFLMFAGIGLDASIARKVNLPLKRRTGEFAFWVEGFRHLATWRPETFTVEVDGREYEGVFALIGNGKGYGGGISVTPNARLEEPWFEVYILPRRSTNLAYLNDLAMCYRGRPAATGATIIRGKKIKANSSDEPWVEVDGEIIGPLPMTFEVVPDALSLIVP